MTNSSAPSQAADLKTSRSVARFPLWIFIVVILGALLSITGAVISKVNPTLLTSGGTMTETARVYADYMFARSLALAIMLLFLLFIRSRRVLASFMVLIALIQLIDGVDDLVRGAFLLVPGLLVFALVFFAGAWKLFGQPFWHLDAWRES
ncbi:hypothetical protein [Tengunoibacter tsumagoiensis]|uniref:Uncharacterized protein n=1 Tax=Tengunoibacter tsumagoiensis TaxID=2014871 RepID=A0A402A915_9CHLR|nr:hypothetical protein [Tengunoibacter tsumagoiensis]GCE15674.1 hypothetical protein KTT_55330 [Tengunoibacter tsumagoiensis]